MLLTSPNGVLVDASESAAPALLADGWRPAAKPMDEAVDLSSLTVAALRALCDDRGIDASKRAKKAQLIALLTD